MRPTFGAVVEATGTRFSLPSVHAERLILELYASGDASTPTRVVPLEPETHRHGNVWSVHLPHVGPGQCYGWRAEGPWAPQEGLRFNPKKLLMDPWARAFAGTLDTSSPHILGHAGPNAHSPANDLVASTLDSAGATWKSVVVAPTRFEGAARRPSPSRHPLIVELHIGNHTRSPTSGVAHPGTYRGVIDTIPHLRRLGATAVELLPVHAFNPLESVGNNPVTGERLRNVWGYNSVGFFAPHAGYASGRDPLAPAAEFKEMVEALHEAGIAVILDVVYNHTAEGSELGPTLSFRGLDNPTWYLLTGGGRTYRNASGCGNTLRCGHPIVQDLILDSLRLWVTELGVDGFRFDLAPILGRGMGGQWGGEGGLLERIAHDPVLADTLLISESWDAEGLYVVGGLSPRYLEWNGRYRDDVRRFVRADAGLTYELARRFGGSRDVFPGKQDARASVNFVTCHDGFTLRDLVSYDQKHNAENGEDGRDGSNHNLSDNCGVEGESGDPRVEALRRRQARNFLTLLLMSRGTPMLLHGDELWRTQRGNNNTWCQDGPVSWVPWHDDPLTDFVVALSAFRRRHPALARTGFVDPAGGAAADVHFHGLRLGEPDFAPNSRTLFIVVQGSCVAEPGTSQPADLAIVCNAWRAALDFQLPGGRTWRRVVDTALGWVADDDDTAPLVADTVRVEAFSTVVLVGLPLEV